VAAYPPLTVTGTVTRAGSLPAAGGPPPGGYPVWVRTSRPLPQRLVGVPVRLTIAAPLTSGPVLVVPVSALFSGRPGRPEYVVVVAGSSRRPVPVFAGATADGLVAVQPTTAGSLRPGERVLVGLAR